MIDGEDKQAIEMLLKAAFLALTPFADLAEAAADAVRAAADTKGPPIMSVNSLKMSHFHAARNVRDIIRGAMALFDYNVADNDNRRPDNG